MAPPESLQSEQRPDLRISLESMLEKPSTTVSGGRRVCWFSKDSSQKSLEQRSRRPLSVSWVIIFVRRSGFLKRFVLAALCFHSGGRSVVVGCSVPCSLPCG